MSKYFLIIGGLFVLIFGSLNISAQDDSSKSKKPSLTKIGSPISIPQPPYPIEALDKKLNGKVKVQVTIDEIGNVIAAKAVSGRSLFRPAAEKAAMEAKFTPSLADEKPVQVTSFIVYNFVY